MAWCVKRNQGIDRLVGKLQVLDIATCLLGAPRQPRGSGGRSGLGHDVFRQIDADDTPCAAYATHPEQIKVVSQIVDALAVAQREDRIGVGARFGHGEVSSRCSAPADAAGRMKVCPRPRKCRSDQARSDGATDLGHIGYLGPLT